MNVFRSSEIITVAIQIEKNGFAFFTKVKNKSRSFPVQELFKYLADEEIKHQHTFEELLKLAENYEPAEAYPGELRQYLEALAAENVFTNDATIKDMAQKTLSDKEAIQLGIGFEKDSIIFFTEIKKFIPEKEQKLIDTIIEEEKLHLRKLTQLRQEVSL
ncbi:ferritin family protein [Candidatus Omnitrophota bacterium]